MPAGLEIINDAGYFQIDSTFKNHRLTQTGTLTIPPPTVFGIELIAGEANTFITAVNPILAYRSGSCWAMVALVRTLTPTTFQIKALSHEPGPVEYFIFDQVAPSPTNYGLQVYAADGSLVYDSNDKSLRVLDIFNQGSVLLGFDSQRSYPGKKVAVVTSGVIRLIRALTGANENMGLGCKTIGDSVLSHKFTTVRKYATGSGLNYISSRVASRLVVDVTGY